MKVSHRKPGETRGKRLMESVPDRPDFGYWLRESRKAAKLTQQELGAAVGLSYQYISNLEHNRSGSINNLPVTLTAERIIALAEAMHLDIDNALVLWGFAPRLSGSGSVVVSRGNAAKIMQSDGSSDDVAQAVQRLLCEAERLRDAADELERAAQNLKGR